MDADVINVGTGPTGRMPAGELRLAGVRPLVLERQPQPRDTPEANGLGGQILNLRGVFAFGALTPETGARATAVVGHDPRRRRDGVRDAAARRGQPGMAASVRVNHAGSSSQDPEHKNLQTLTT